MAHWDTEVLRAVRQASRRSHSAHRGFVELDDLTQEAYIYVLENPTKMDKWLGMEREGMTLLQHAIYQHLHRVTMKERYRKDGTKPEDYYVYQTAVIQELLSDALSPTPIVLTSVSDLSTGRSGRDPAEGGDRMAMIADVKSALGSLNEYELSLITHKYANGGVSDNELAQWFEKPEPTINRHVRAAIRKMARNLGSEPIRRRKVMSNAQAQHTTREQG